MPPLISEEEMDAMSSGDGYDDEPMSMEMLEDIQDSRKSHLSVNRRETRYKICDCIKQIQTEWKEVLLSTQNIVKVLHKFLKDVVNEILQELPPLGESGSEDSYFIPYSRNFAKVTSLSDDINKPWIK